MNNIQSQKTYFKQHNSFRLQAVPFWIVEEGARNSRKKKPRTGANEGRGTGGEAGKSLFSSPVSPRCAAPSRLSRKGLQAVSSSLQYFNSVLPVCTTNIMVVSTDDDTTLSKYGHSMVTD